MAEIVIKDVPQELYDLLESRAAHRQQSVQEYMLAELKRTVALTPADEPLSDDWLREVRKWVETERVSVSAGMILAARDEGRE